MVQLAEIIDPRNVACGVSVSSKKKALHHLASILSDSVNAPAQPAATDGRTRAAENDSGYTAASQEDEILGEMDILDALISRERLGSTALGQGVAVPHGRIADLQKPVAALVTLTEGIEFDAPDDSTVDILFALLVPESSTDDHLAILSLVAEKFSQKELTDQLRYCSENENKVALEIFCQTPEKDT